MNTRQIIFYCMLVCLFTYPSFSAYTYEVYEYGESKTLKNTESILFDQDGGMHIVTLQDKSSSEIVGTSDLVEGFGGIWEFRLGYDSSLYMFGGQVHEINIGNDATAILSGGIIEEIWSYQSAWKNDQGNIVPNPHITIEYSGDLPTMDSENILTGLWGNGDPFSIKLHDVDGYSPTIENIQFVPEPATLILFGLGGLLLRRKK